MATQDPYHDPDLPGEAPSCYISPTADFFLLFALATAIAIVAASVLLP